MATTLEIPAFQAIEGFKDVFATNVQPGVLSVELTGDDAGFVHAAGVRMMHGPVDAVLDGAPIRIYRFVVLNQGDCCRVVMTVRYKGRDGQH